MELEKLIPQIDLLFAQWDTTRSPGCALALIQDGEIIYQRGYGMASLEFGVPITPATLFQIGSISKQFTAMAVALLAADGAISLDDEARQYVPEIPEFGEKITIRQLVHHTSGLRSLDEVKMVAGGSFEDVTLVSEYMEMLSRQQALNFKPGEKHLYCNTGYTIMAAIVERVSGKTMREFCEERLFKPLGMRHTFFHDNYRMVVPGLAQSYAPAAPGCFEREALLHGLPGSTSLLTSVEDLLYWDQEFYSGRVVGKQVIDQMHEVGVLNDGSATEYAFGIHVSQYRGLKTVSHGGADAGYRSILLRFPDQRFTVIILSNLADLGPDAAARKVADLVLADQFTEEATTQVEPEPVSVAEEVLQSYTGLYYNPDSGMGPGYKLAVRDGKLVIDQGPGFELIPLADDLFCIAAMKAVRVQLDREEGGDLRLSLLTGGEPIRFRRVQEAHPDEAQLQAYAGRYTSLEMDTTFQVMVQEGGLWIKMKRLGQLSLQPTIQDGFALDLSKVVKAPYALTLDFYQENGGVAGFHVSSGRAKRQQFIRQ